MYIYTYIYIYIYIHKFLIVNYIIEKINFNKGFNQPGLVTKS